MLTVPSTVEMILSKALNRDIDQRWIDWATEMMTEGHEGTYLAILAGEREPFNQFQMQVRTDSVFAELKLDHSNRDTAIHSYVRSRIACTLRGEVETSIVLQELRDLHLEIGDDSELQDSYLLSCAKEDIDLQGVQWYWEGATVDNIDSIITEYFTSWMSAHHDNT